MSAPGRLDPAPYSRGGPGMGSRRYARGISPPSAEERTHAGMAVALSRIPASTRRRPCSPPCCSNRRRRAAQVTTAPLQRSVRAGRQILRAPVLPAVAVIAPGSPRMWRCSRLPMRFFFVQRHFPIPIGSWRSKPNLQRASIWAHLRSCTSTGERRRPLSKTSRPSGMSS